MDNTFGMFLNLAENLKHYEESSAGEKKSPYTVLVEMLQAPYNELRNFQAFEDVLRKTISEDAAEAWTAYPDFTYQTKPVSVREASEKMRPELRSRAAELTEELLAADLLYPDVNEQGEAAYTRNYLFGIAFDAMYFPGTSPFEGVSFDWWFDLLEGDTAKLRAPLPEYRVLAHEGTLTGDAKHGKIPMDLDIPDMRQLLAMDSAEAILEGRRCIAVMDCLCRMAKEAKGERSCDYPIEEVCIIFDQMAEGGIDAGYARKITKEEALEILSRCRDLGLVQQVSDAVNPLSLCNCCECCCLCIASMKRYEGTVSKPSRFAADMAHRESCVACGACVETCPVDAIEIQLGSAQIKPQKCIGCGLCVSKCPKGALHMNKRAGSDDMIERFELEKFYI